ncbi:MULTISPECIES: hypothetical protein [unclassified Spirosoma]|uniref:hypothetical protein n=1 Tax=unclassified Spirosoma TaxID=2621999 RepID=UPI001ACF63DC|nr:MULTISPECIES: hypothetical protein [unclassified Spirosoma]MBN8824885.1 hypothetical protein [Spirosoma sp.]
MYLSATDATTGYAECDPVMEMEILDGTVLNGMPDVRQTKAYSAVIGLFGA